jgi:hypothetical protein
MSESDGGTLDLFAAEFGALEKRCEEAGLEFEETVEEGERFAVVTFRAGSKHRYVGVGEARIEDFLAFPFEAYSFIERYDAICSYEENSIEGILEAPAGGTGNWRRLAGVRSPDDLPDVVLELRGPHGERVSIAKPSHGIRLLTRGPAKIALRIEGIEISAHDQASEVMDKVANSLLFDLDGRLGVPLVIRRQRPLFIGARLSRGGSAPPERFPTSQFDPEPMSLYWYGRSAARMPLLQFLAYYQILEFYFDLHFQTEARQRIGNVIRDPGFDPFSERDITRVLNAGRRNGQRGAGDERSQLRSTVRGCAEADRVRKFAFSKRNKKFFEKKKNGLTDFVIKASMSDDELLESVANRLYDIRCKIVHTKSGGGGEELDLLLPFSSEADELGRDTEILHMIARAALVSGSRPLQVPGIGLAG